MTISITAAAARRFLIHAFAIDGFQTQPDIAAVLDRLESVQLDSINVCGRIHDLILWSRVADYTPRRLHDALYEAPRTAFETYFPNLHALPIADFPYFVRAMHARRLTPGRWHGLLPEEEPIAEQILAQLDADGPMRTRASGSEHGHTTSGWGTRQLRASHVMEKLWLQGRLGIAKRENFERWYDRAERLLPAVDADSLPTETDETVFKARKRLRTHRIFRPRKDAVAALGKDAFIRVEIEGVARTWTILAEDVDAIEAAAAARPVSDDVVLLAPLDPLVYDRDRTLDLFGFDYRWEVYTPQAKRRWGYYVLPILWRDRLVGRVDPKIDRKTRTLTLHSLLLEPEVVDDDVAALIAPLAERLRAYAAFLGAERIAVTRLDPRLAALKEIL